MSRKVSKLINRYTPVVADNRIEKARLTVVSTLTTSVAGSWTTVFTMNPSSSSEWTTFTNLYDQFRVIGVRLRLVSNQQFSVTKANDMAVFAFDNDNTTALASVDAGLQYNTSHVLSAVWTHSSTGALEKNGVIDLVWMRPTAGRNTAIDWIDAATPANSLGGVKCFAQALTASTQYMTVAIEYYVEFRGRQ